MRIKTMPTKSLGSLANPLTPMSPTMPMHHPAARPVIPTQRPDAKWIHPENSEYLLLGSMSPEISTDATSP
ncbi:hypothetical protein GGF41_008960 [Coemansia sp. RSA 2531]|nr:hypothetical protein GGF41_008960 [Coemansia sp. RSA 2531]